MAASGTTSGHVVERSPLVLLVDHPEPISPGRSALLRKLPSRRISPIFTSGISNSANRPGYTSQWVLLAIKQTGFRNSSVTFPAKTPLEDGRNQIRGNKGFPGEEDYVTRNQSSSWWTVEAALCGICHHPAGDMSTLPRAAARSRTTPSSVYCLSIGHKNQHYVRCSNQANKLLTFDSPHAGARPTHPFWLLTPR
jgi:hypothetical protein